MTAPDSILELVERFDRNLQDYRSGKYNETQVRREFVDPLFKALGWDIDNEEGFAEKYKDVIHEDAVKVGGATKAPDYSFRVGGTRKFFVEAKKPSVNVKEDTSPAYQVRRYAWSAKLPVSILTDFEEFAVYDCRNRPKKDDNAAVNRIMYITYKEYAEQWELLQNTFSKDAVLKGSFDKYVDDSTKAKGTQEVDDAFLAEIERWRDVLARNLALRNEGLTQRQLNFAVQRTIDRIIFLRIAEDRGIEPYHQLGDLTQSDNIYDGLLRLFGRADDRYNSGLFYFKEEKGRGYPDYTTQAVQIDDKVLKGILKNLYYPDSPYEFSVLPADILGQVYEQFLGKVIRLTAGHQAKVEEKPEVKKAGGVYYTPTYIVDYIVENTVGKLLADKTPRQAAALRILDPACGSGSFLLGAYQYLLDWHLDYYRQSSVKADQDKIVQVGADDYRLTIEERKRILLNNIYGVDIDTQAVEVTKLSLLLKVLEGENQSQTQMFQQRVLPSLDGNIKCGNSLIGSDFYTQGQISMFDMEEEERYRINVFDWGKEFAEIMAGGGFDAVIGNPPYGATFTNLMENYFRKNYTCAEYQLDSYPIFIEKGLILTKDKSMFGMIIPSAWVVSKFNINLRKLISSNYIENIVIAPKNTFGNATVETLILVIKKENRKNNNYRVIRWDVDNHQDYFLDQAHIEEKTNFNFNVYSPSYINEMIKKIRNCAAPLSDFGEAVWGVKIYQRGKGKPKQKGFESKEKTFHSNEKRRPSHKPLLGGKNIFRYKINWGGYYVDYGEWLAEPRSLDWFEGKRILIREVTAKGIIQACVTNDDYVFSNSVDGVKIKTDTLSIEYILALINSKIISFYHLNSSANAFKASFPKVLIKDILDFPIRTIDFDNPAEVAQHDQMVQMVEMMLALNKQLAAAQTPQEQQSLERQIEATDRQIDQLVYALYGLSEEEIKIVEEAVG